MAVTSYPHPLPRRRKGTEDMGFVVLNRPLMLGGYLAVTWRLHRTLARRRKGTEDLGFVVLNRPHSIQAVLRRGGLSHVTER